MTNPAKQGSAAAGAAAQGEVPPRRYPDLHDHLAALERAGLLVKVPFPVNKDTEMHALVRWQYRGGIKEPDRKAFLFEQPTDAQGTKYDIPVVVGALSANRQIYGLGMDCDVSEVNQRWAAARKAPILPVEIPSAAAPVHEIVYMGDELKVPGHGVDGLPTPISTPGWDNAPYFTVSNFISKDPDSGIHNIGNYRGMVKAPDRVGLNPSVEQGQGIYIHWEKHRARGEALPVAICIGGPPVICYVAVQKLDYDEDEYAVAGGLVKAPIRVVQAKTVPLLVPADAEIVIEGYASTEWLEAEAPFGESHGHVNTKEFNLFVDVTAVTRRRKAVLTSLISQVTPCEASVMIKASLEPVYLDHLKNRIGIKSVTRVSLHEPLTGLQRATIVQFKNGKRADIWRALYATVAYRPAYSKIVIAVDEDVDPESMDAVLWAMSYRSTPHKDIQILKEIDIGHAPRHDVRGTGADDSAVLWDATLKGPMPPLSLPRREYMERAREMWQQLGLPELQPEAPWFGYNLGDWNQELDAEADLAAQGLYWQTGEKIARQRRRTSEVMLNSSFYLQDEK